MPKELQHVTNDAKNLLTVNQQAELKKMINAEYAKCSINPSYFINKYCYIQHPQRGKIPFGLYDFQENVLKDFLTHDKNIILKSRQLGISTLVSAYALWLCLFNEDKNILVIATKQDVAKNIITKFRVMYDNVPSWIRKNILDIENNKLSVRFKNGSQIKAVGSSPDAGRSEALSLLIFDECVDFDSMLTIKNKNTGEIKQISIGNLFLNVSKKNNIKIPDILDTEIQFQDDWEVLTPNGYKDFKGIKKITLNKYHKLLIKQKDDKIIELKCSENHKLKLINNTFIEAKNLKLNDILINDKLIIDNLLVNEPIDLYDLLDVSDGNEYLTNDTVSHNCAFIGDMEAIWTSAQQTLATGGQCIMLSTPCVLGDTKIKIRNKTTNEIKTINIEELESYDI